MSFLYFSLIITGLYGLSAILILLSVQEGKIILSRTTKGLSEIRLSGSIVISGRVIELVDRHLNINKTNQLAYS